MKIYGVNFNITEEHIDKQRIEVAPGEGVVIPLALDRIGGLYNYLVRNRCIRKNKIDMIYIFSVVSCGEVLCVKYLNGDISIIQDVGNIEFCQRLLT